MAEFANQFYSHRRLAVIDEYYSRSRSTEAQRFIELRAAIKIQSLFRRHRQRKQFNIMKAAANNIKRIFRGFCQRKQFW
jgi:hypothetical protein